MSEPPSSQVLVYRHALVTRVTHWINLLALLVLLTSGLQIFNAHPALYWGDTARFAEPWAATQAKGTADNPIGVTKIGSLSFETTGLLGVSGKAMEVRGFPAWTTLPTYRDLGTGRLWHFFFAWLFVLNGLVYLAGNLINGHLKRDLLPDGDQLKPRHLLHEIADHARLRFPKGEEARRYNALQKLTYLAVLFILLPAMLATGLSMSPGLNAAFPWLPELFGGRQSARTLHFISAGLIVAFVVVHVLMVLVSGPVNSLRSMITGRFSIRVEGAKP